MADICATGPCAKAAVHTPITATTTTGEYEPSGHASPQQHKTQCNDAWLTDGFKRPGSGSYAAAVRTVAGAAVPCTDGSHLETT